MRDLWLKNCVCFVIPLSLLIAKGEVHSCRRLLCLACNFSLGSTGKNCSQDFYFGKLEFQFSFFRFSSFVQRVNEAMNGFGVRCLVTA